MMRRWSDGKFRDAPPLHRCPLFKAFARPARSASHCAGHITRACKRSSKNWAVIAALNADVARTRAAALA